MIKKTFVLLFVCALFLGSCGDDSKGDFNYPIRIEFKGITKEGQIEVWTNNNGSVEAVPLDQTTLDEDETFTDIETVGTFTFLNFISDSQVEVFSEGDLLIGDTLTVDYTCEGDELTIPVSFFNITATGSPESFDLISQAYVEDDGAGFTLGVSGATRTSIDFLKANLEVGATIAIINYTESYGQ